MFNFLKKLRPFGQKEELVLSEFEREGIHTLVTKFPELWEPVKKVIYSKMNSHTRKLVTAPVDEVLKLQSKIVELDSVITDILEIKKSFVKISKNPQKTQSTEQSNFLSKENMLNNQEIEDKNVIMDYIMSRDVRDKDGKIRLSA